MLTSPIFHDFVGSILLGTGLDVMVMRLLGAKIGARASIGKLRYTSDVSLFSVGSDAWFGQASYISCTASSRSSIRLAPVKIGSGNLLAERIVLGPGSKVGNGCTVGSLTLVEDTVNVRDHTTWVGSPAFLVKDESAKAHMAPPQGAITKNKKQTKRGGRSPAHHSGLRVLGVRLVHTLATIFLAGALALGVAPGYFAWLQALKHWGLYLAVLLFPLVVLSWSVCVCLLTTVARLVVSPKEFAGEHVLWGAHYAAWQLVARITQVADSVFLPFMGGTTLSILWLKLNGASVGKNVFYNSAVPPEASSLTLGDGCVVDRNADLTLHTVDQKAVEHVGITVGARSCINGLAMVQAGCIISPDTTLSPLTVVLKGDQPPPSTHWQGNPMQLVNEI